MKQPTRCPGPINRRSFLEIGSLALGGLGMADLLRGQAVAKENTAKENAAKASAARSQADGDPAVILIWLQGGPSHMETYDLKPDAPVEYRGEMKPIQTVAAGIDICELLPLHAKVADKFNIIRSISHGFANHAGGAGRFLSGRNPLRVLDPIAQFPCIGPVVSKVQRSRDIGLPNYVGSAIRVYGGGGSYLGDSTLPFVVSGDPNAEKFQVRNLSLAPQLANRLDDRVGLLKAFDGFRRDVDHSGSMQAMDQYNRRAVNMLTSDKARDAFDLSQEDDKTRDLYGRTKWGQRALLARRLAEAGVSFITMQMQNPRVPGAIGNWDIHAVNGHLFNDARARLPVFDQAVAGLIEDIYRRGLDKKVMVIVSGEFGRTPRINPQKGTKSKIMQPGRDHWPGAMSVLVSGGNMRTGQVIGSTTSNGAYAKDRKMEPNDLLATIYRHLNIDYNMAFADHSGRPMPILPYGKPISELL